VHASASSVTAPGWSFQNVGGNYADDDLLLVVLGIAPDTDPTTFQVTISGTTCANGHAEIGDELAAIDPDAGPLAFDAFDADIGTGGCSNNVLSRSADVAVWTSCLSTGTVTGVDPGFTYSQDNGTNLATARRITEDAADTDEYASFEVSPPLAAYAGSTVSIQAP
jgi:hypothetical protein